jgi:hypothetical protein
VPFTEGFAALRRIGLQQVAIAVRQDLREEVNLPFHPADHRQRFAKVNLRVPRIVSQRAPRMYACSRAYAGDLVAPGVIPEFPPSVPGVSYNFRCAGTLFDPLADVPIRAVQTPHKTTRYTADILGGIATWHGWKRIDTAV